MSATNLTQILEQQIIQVLLDGSCWYECPKDALGRRLGPLVGYAGTDAQGRHYVGDVYINIAMLEQFPNRLMYCADLLGQFFGKGEVVFCGAPMGGITLASLLAFEKYSRFIYPEKEIVCLATGHSREESRLVFKRHEVHRGDRVVLVEDVCNNFSTTAELIELISAAGGTVSAIVCIVNRSGISSYEHTSVCGSHALAVYYPVHSLLSRPFMQYSPDDPDVVDDIARGNVVWKPKHEWSRLMAAMNTSAHC